MSKLLWMLACILCFGVQASSCDKYNSLSPLQKGRLEFSYHQGKPYNLGYTLASIALVESSAGRYRVNMDSRDLGLYQIHTSTAVNTLGITNHYKRLELYEKLIYQDPLNAYIALEVLQYFKAYHKGDWRKMVKSYNSGFKINTQKAHNYLDKVVVGVKLLEKCMIIH